MAEVKWIKIVTDIFDDEKIQYIETMPNGDEIIVIWFRIMCLAGKSNCGGLLMMTDRIPYTDEMLSAIFRRDVKSINMALNVFKNLGMVELTDNNAIYLPNWEKHQNQEKLDQIKEQNRIRQERHRNKLVTCHAKKRDSNVTRPLLDRYSNATDIDIDIDKDKKSVSKNTPPTVEEVTKYCAERNNNIDASYFIDYYSARGWQLKNGVKMKDWKAAVRTWEKRDAPKKSNLREVTDEWTS